MVTEPSREIANQESSCVGTSGGLPAGTVVVCARASAVPLIEKAITTAPVLLSTERRENSVFAFIAFSSRHRIGCALHCAHDCGMGTAAAFQARQSLLDLGVCRFF